MKPTRLSLSAARRIALAAQGFGRGRPSVPTMRHVQRVIDDVGQFQLDSINVAVRAHYMPLFSRLGPYDRALLERAAGRAPRRLFEYWGHAACLIDVRLQPALRMRMRRPRPHGEARVERILRDKPDLLQRILDDIGSAGPLTPRDIDNAEERRRDHWGWNWSEARYLLEHEFDTGRLSVAQRNTAFERRYDLTERVLPPDIVAQPDPSVDESHDVLISRAARALGVFDLTALSAYFSVRKAEAAASLDRLATAGLVAPVSVGELPQPHWVWVDAARPRALEANALVSPFDSLAYERSRLLGLFGVHYRIEVYVPAPQRRYGYYVYLFLSGDSLAARVDLKGDRARGALVVRSAWLIESADAVHTARQLAAELQSMAGWLGLGDVVVEPRGDLAVTLAAALG